MNDEDVVLTVSSSTLFVILAFGLGVTLGVAIVRLWAGRGGRW